MTEISNMVSYYNPLMYRQQPSVAQQQSATSMSPGEASPQQQLGPPGQAAAAAVAAAQQHVVDSQQCAWYGGYGHPHSHHHAAAVAAQQYLEHEMPLWTPHPHPHSYLQYQQQQQAAYHQQQQQQHQQQQQQQQQQLQISSVQGSIEWSGDEANNSGVGAGEPSPPITVSGSEISSPGTPASPGANNNNVSTANNNNTTPMRPGQNRSPYEWMKKPSYQTQPNPACNIASTTAVPSLPALHDLCTLEALGKTRTKDKYRVVYTEHQRLELEKEFYSSKYITIRRKAELATSLALSERQVKIWFQNRRAKERKQSKKLEQRDVKPMLDAHGVAHPGHAVAHAMGAGHAHAHAHGHAHGHPPVSGMAGLSLGGMSMSGMLGSLIHQNGSPPLVGHHHHHTGAAAAAAHHALIAASSGHPHHAPPPQHSVLGM